MENRPAGKAEVVVFGMLLPCNLSYTDGRAAMITATTKRSNKADRNNLSV